MYCGNCGVENSNTAKFCKECGSPLPQAKIVAPIKVQTSVSEEASIKLAEPNVEMTRAKKESVKIPWKIIGAIVGAIALIAIVYFVIQSNKVINLNDYMRIEYAGYDKYGKANAYVDWNGLKEKYGDKLKFSKEGKAELLREAGGFSNLLAPLDILQSSVGLYIDNVKGLKNGDKVAFTWKVSEPVESYFNYKIKYTNGESEVTGLENVGKFDAFSDVTVNFSGMEPAGTAKLNSKNNYINTRSYFLNKSEGLSNGDVVIVTIDSRAIEPCVEKNGMVPEVLYKRYTVSGLGKYLEDPDEIPQNVLDSMINKGRDVYSAHIKEAWTPEEELVGLDYIGNIMLVTKDKDRAKNHNILYLVYKVQAHDTFSSKGSTFDELIPSYWYIAYRDLTDADDASVKLNNYESAEEKVYVDSGISTGWFTTKKWFYYGYETLDAVVDAVVKSNSRDYDSIKNVDESAFPTLVIEKTEHVDNGDFVLPTSNTELLSESDLLNLTEEECRIARNEIYARHGRQFNDKELQTYFDSKSWYNGTISPSSFNESLLSSIEAANLKVIQDYEKKHGYNK